MKKAEILFKTTNSDKWRFLIIFILDYANEIKFEQTVDYTSIEEFPVSTVKDHMGLEVCGISCITNMAAGISKVKNERKQELMRIFVIKGNICYSKTSGKLCIIGNGYVVCENGICAKPFIRNCTCKDLY